MTKLRAYIITGVSIAPANMNLVREAPARGFKNEIKKIWNKYCQKYCH